MRYSGILGMNGLINHLEVGILKEVKIKVPDSFFTFWESEETLAKRMLFLTVIDLLRAKKISKGKAAELLDLSVHDMFDFMGQYGIETVNYSVEDLEKEREIWKKLMGAA